MVTKGIAYLVVDYNRTFQQLSMLCRQSRATGMVARTIAAAGVALVVDGMLLPSSRTMALTILSIDGLAPENMLPRSTTSWMSSLRRMSCELPSLPGPGSAARGT